MALSKALAVIPRERLLAIRGNIHICARIWGDEDAAVPPENRWLALHGFLDNAASYDKLAPELLKIGASSVVCLDFAGHADALKWDKFSIIGHSLGGGVAQGVAAACPDRVLRVVSIEALSWWPQEPRHFVSNLRTHLSSRPRGANLNVFTSLHDCAKRRSAMNIVGSLDATAAMILVSRGTKKVDEGYTWASDPSLLLPTRARVDEDSCRNILESISCPSVVLYAQDGMWKKAQLFQTRLFTLPWALAVVTAHVVTGVWHYLSTLGSPLSTDLGSARASVASRIKYVYVCILRRWLVCKRTTFVSVKHGGHHPHLTQAPVVAHNLALWLSGLGKVHPLPPTLSAPSDKAE